MKQRSRLCILLAWLVALSPLATAAAAQDNLEEFRSAIRVRYDLKERAFAENDPDFIVEEFYSEDVFSVDNEGILHHGREALRPIYAEVVPGSTVRIESVKAYTDGDLGWDWTNFYVTPDDPAADPFSFIILFLWEKRDNKWWCVGESYQIGELAAPSH